MWVNGWGEWFGGESFVKCSLLYFIKNSLLNWSGTSSRKIYKRIPCNFDLCSFYKELSWDYFFTWKSFVKFFRIFKLESDFFPHFFAKSENSKIVHIYFLWTSHDPIFSEIGDKKILHFHFTFTSLSLSLHFTSLHWRLTLQVSRVVPT